MSAPVSYNQPEFLQYLRRRKDVIERLSAAIREYLLDNIEETIKSTEEAPRQMFQPRPTIDDLSRAQSDVDVARDAMEALERFLEGMPAATAEFMEATQRPMLDRTLKMAEDRVSEIQKLLEAPSDPDKPWVGKLRMTMACAQCAKPSASSDYSTKTLNVKVFDEGWRRDSDGDWICAACVSAALASESVSGSSAPSNKKESL